MAQAIVIHQPGGPGVLRPQTITVGKPGPNELRIRQTAIGVNFHDVYVRSGLYQTLALPGMAFELPDAAKAHEMLESRERTEALLLKP